MYQDADIYLLDDPLSAVDAEVGRHLFEQWATSELQFVCDPSCLTSLCSDIPHTFTYADVVAAGLSLSRC